jgi:preprotein translocase subunit SecA
VQRRYYPSKVFGSSDEKWAAVVQSVREHSGEKRPVLVGTTSVEKSEKLSVLLTRKYGIKHEVLNAKQHEREASIVAVAGHQHKNVHGEMAGNVTIATNMAGRGTDIKLAAECHKSGGLHVIGTERHTARRIDNQLRGRGGRQGDPGSSRFYVSLQDDLMKMFAGEWTIKVLGFLGMQEGEHIEDKRITKGIIRAQKKVEERNFLARKNLLEYDEVMDHQRGGFYGMRQRVLEGHEVDQVIWEMIGDAITDAVQKYITQDYVAANIAEWARVNFGVSLEAEDLRGMRSLHDLEDYIKAQARVDVEDKIGRGLTEYMGEDVSDDPKEWDTRGLSSWAMSQFGVNITQAQMKKMSAKEVEETLKEAALEQIDKRGIAGLDRYLEPLYAEQELAAWAKDKFAIDISPTEMVVEAVRDQNQRKSAGEIAELIETRAREAYARREVEYPVDHVLTFVSGGENVDRIENPYAADYVRQWARTKYGIELSEADVRGQSLRKLRDQLIGLQETYLRDGKIDAEVDTLMKTAGVDKPVELSKAVKERFGFDVYPDEIEDASVGGASDDGNGSGNGNGNGERVSSLPGGRAGVRELLVRRAKHFLRQELTDLEQFVLIQILDQSWKDHLYAMDMLKAGIGLVGFAEKDPRVMYKVEGYRYFEEMMAGIRDKVTDLIFRARVVGQAQARSNYRETAAVHEDAGGYGVGENVRQTAGEVPIAAAGGGDGEDARAGDGGAAELAKVKTIVREAPKVGRNDPCPCGSGKKYKKCHGADVA